MHLKLEADGQVIGQEPFDDLFGVDFGEDGGEEDFARSFFDVMPGDHVAGPFVVFAGGEDEFDLVLFLQEGDVFQAVFSTHAAVGAFEVHDGVDAGIDGADVVRTAGFEEDFAALVGKGGHEGVDVWLEEGFSAGDFHHWNIKSFHFVEDGGEAHFVTFVKGVLGVAPDAAEVAVGEPHEGAGESGVGAFALYAFVDFVDHESCGGWLGHFDRHVTLQPRPGQQNLWRRRAGGVK